MSRGFGRGIPPGKNRPLGPLLVDGPEIRGNLRGDGEIPGLYVREGIRGVPEELVAFPDGEDDIGEGLGDLGGDGFPEGGDHEFYTPEDLIGFPLNVGDEDEVAEAPGGEFVEGVHDEVLGDTPLGHVLHGFIPHYSIHSDTIKCRQRINNKHRSITPRIHRTVLLSIFLVGEVVKLGVEVEHEVGLGAFDVLHLCEAGEVEFPDVVGHRFEGVEALGFPGEVEVMEVRGDGFPGVGVSPDEGFEAGFQEEGEDIEPGVNEGFDGISLPGARGAHEEDVEAGVGGGKVFHIFSNFRKGME